MNKPSKQTVSFLRSALDQLDVISRPGRVFTPGEADTARDYVKRALDQLTQDDQLSCPFERQGCPVVKPTKRALSAHVSGCLYRLYRGSAS